MTDEIEFILLFGLAFENKGVVSFLDGLITNVVEIYPQAVLLFIDRDDVLRKLFEAENSFVLFPIYLKAAVWK